MILEIIDQHAFASKFMYEYHTPVYELLHPRMAVSSYVRPCSYFNERCLLLLYRLHPFVIIKIHVQLWQFYKHNWYKRARILKNDTNITLCCGNRAESNLFVIGPTSGVDTMYPSEIRDQITILLCPSRDT